jgi:cytochrome c oxidase cbb3-type subunit I/II
VADLEAQAAKIVANLKKDGIEASPDVDIIALIAYLQRLGTDIKQQPATQVVQAQ